MFKTKTIVVCTFVLYLLIIALFVLLRFTASGYTFGIYHTIVIGSVSNQEVTYVGGELLTNIS